jgi:hypothetical protein
MTAEDINLGDVATDAAASASLLMGNMTNLPQNVVVHPLVLLSVVDHYNRVARSTKKRVVGLLLGQNDKGKVNVANSFGGNASPARL